MVHFALTSFCFPSSRVGRVSQYPPVPTRLAALYVHIFLCTIGGVLNAWPIDPTRTLPHSRDTANASLLSVSSLSSLSKITNTSVQTIAKQHSDRSSAFASRATVGLPTRLHIARLGGFGCRGAGRFSGEEPATHGVLLALHDHLAPVLELEALVVVHLLHQTPATQSGTVQQQQVCVCVCVCGVSVCVV